MNDQSPESPAPERWMRWAPPALLVALTLAAFMPTLRNGFVAWDDLDNFTLNQSYRGLGWPQIKWMFTSAKLGHYIPVTWLTLGLDYVLWGMNAAGYHLTSLLIHAGGALALYFLALRLFELARPEAPPLDLRVGAFLASLVFAVHPFRVESVAWVTERRDVVSGLFYVLTVLAYLKAVAGRERPRPGWYVASLGLFAAALLSKSIVVTLPAALVILDVYPLRRLGGARGWLRWRVWLEKLPYLALSAITTLIAFMALFTLQNTRSLEHMSVLHRIVLSVYGLTFYLVKTVAPLELAPLCELAVVFVPWWYFAFVLAAITVCVAFRRRWPALTAGGALYIVTLAPVLGTFQNGPQAAADRYTYLACLGWALLLGAAAVGGWVGSNVTRGVLAIWILALMPLTWQQVHVWHDPVTMWQHDVAVYPNARAGNYNLAAAYENAGRYAEAIVHYREIQRLSVRKAQWYVPMGEVYEKAKVYRLAIESFREALRLDPDLSKPACAGLMRIRERTSLSVEVPQVCQGARF